MRFAASSWRFWDQKGHLVEGRRRVEDARCARTRVREEPARAQALSGAADMALTSGDMPAGGRWARKALGLYKKLGDAWGTAFSRLMVAYATGQEGDWPRAQALFGESVRDFRELGDRHYALRAARAHAWAHYEGGNLDRARALYEEILREAREAHNPFPRGSRWAPSPTSRSTKVVLPDAVPLTTDSHQIFRDLGDLLMVAGCVCRSARILALSGRPEIAARVLSSSAARLKEIGAMPAHIAKIRDQACAAVHPTRRCRLRQGMGGRSGVDRGRGHRLGPRVPRLKCSSASGNPRLSLRATSKMRTATWHERASSHLTRTTIPIDALSDQLFRSKSAD